MTLMIAALMDGKIGHERQVLGFIKALKKSRNVKVHELQVLPDLGGFWLGALSSG